MSAANTVLENGGRVVLLDKSSFCGGNSTKATSGINGANTKTQRENGIEDSSALFTQDKTNSEKLEKAVTLASRKRCVFENAETVRFFNSAPPKKSQRLFCDYFLAIFCDFCSKTCDLQFAILILLRLRLFLAARAVTVDFENHPAQKVGTRCRRKVHGSFAFCGARYPGIYSVTRFGHKFSRAAKRGGFQTGGFPGNVSRSVLQDRRSQIASDQCYSTHASLFSGTQSTAARVRLQPVLLS